MREGLIKKKRKKAFFLEQGVKTREMIHSFCPIQLYRVKGSFVKTVILSNITLTTKLTVTNHGAHHSTMDTPVYST